MVMYGHPENYPPTLNAINELFSDFSIKIVYRSHQASCWDYPDDVELIPDGKVISARQQENLPIFQKILLFLNYTWILYSELLKFRPQVILMYDSLSTLAYFLVPKFGSANRKSIIWYHNHDVSDPSLVRKYSLSWFALKTEKRLFSRLDIFSLPALDRKQFFPLEKLKGKFVFLPNFPAKKLYTPYFDAHKQLNEVRILFQGQLGEGHGIEELISMLPFSVNGLSVKLVLRGHARNGYDEWLNKQIETRQLQDWLEVHPFTPYKYIPELGSKCHIGLAVFKKQDIMNRTIGTASNKIYEYAALGLPILYFNTPYFKEHLGKYVWAKDIDSNPDTIKAQIADIIDNYPQYAQTAHLDFIQDLNFEHYFSAVKLHLNIPTIHIV